MVDVVGVPQRVEQLVRETQRQDVLNRLLTEVVVDAEHRILGKHLADNSIERPALVRSWPNGFSITTRLHRPSSGPASPDRDSCEHTTGNESGGIDR